MPELTNADRAERARVAFDVSPHARENNDSITNLYDFICDLGHLADVLATEDTELEHTFEKVGGKWKGERPGDYVLRMGEWHYDEECYEEEAERGA